MLKVYKEANGRLAQYEAGNEPAGAVELSKANAKAKVDEDVLAEAKAKKVKNKSAK